jgi:hypothetical protein
MKDARVRIRGKIWKIRFQTPLKLNGKRVRGYCDNDTREICYDGGPDAIFTLIHETLHACLWDLDETAVSETEEAIQQVLIKTGVIPNPNGRPDTKRRQKRGTAQG